MIKIFIAEDLGLFREGLHMLLESQKDIEIIGEAANGLEALHKVSDLKPDIVISDIQMPEMDGIEMTLEIKKYYPDIEIIALTQHKEDFLVVEMFEAGAKGYLLKDSSKMQLVDAINAVDAGGYYFCDKTSMKLSKLIAASKIDAFPRPDPDKFSDVELEIIRLICKEYSSKEISDKLNLGIRTVESYRHRIFAKVGARNMAGLVIYAIKFGIYTE